MIGDTSLYPVNIDSFFNVYNEDYTGYSIPDERKTISGDNYQVVLNHLAKQNSIAISGYTEVLPAATLNQGEFKVTDYVIPAVTRTGIDYYIGQTLQFHSTAAGNEIKISYTSPGDKINSTLLNKNIDAIYNIEKILGTIGTGKNLDIGAYSNLALWLTYFFSVFQTHTHSGASNTGFTRQLDGGAIKAGSIVNSLISASAAIAQSKLQKGILDSGIAFIPVGTDKYVDIQSSAWATSNHIVTLTRGAYGYTDPGTTGSLSFIELVAQDGFRVNFFSDTSSLATVIPFVWILR